MGYEAMHNVLRYEHFFLNRNIILFSKRQFIKRKLDKRASSKLKTFSLQKTLLRGMFQEHI